MNQRTETKESARSARREGMLFAAIFSNGGRALDANLITGQQNFSGKETAELLIAALGV